LVLGQTRFFDCRKKRKKSEKGEKELVHGIMNIRFLIRLKVLSREWGQKNKSKNRLRESRRIYFGG